MSAGLGILTRGKVSNSILTKLWGEEKGMIHSYGVRAGPPFAGPVSYTRQRPLGPTRRRGWFRSKSVTDTNVTQDQDHEMFIRQ